MIDFFPKNAGSPSCGGGDDVWPVVAWRCGAAKLGGEHGVATSVEAWPSAAAVVAPLLWP
jgi:hypothetical protein